MYRCTHRSKCLKGGGGWNVIQLAEKKERGEREKGYTREGIHNLDGAYSSHEKSRTERAGICDVSTRGMNTCMETQGCCRPHRADKTLSPVYSSY